MVQTSFRINPTGPHSASRPVRKEPSGLETTSTTNTESPVTTELPAPKVEPIPVPRLPLPPIEFPYRPIRLPEAYHGVIQLSTPIRGILEVPEIAQLATGVDGGVIIRTNTSAEPDSTRW